MKIGILFHDNCFDGLTSAGLFLSFAQARIDQAVQPIFGGLAHGPLGEGTDVPMDTGPLGPARLVGDINAIVDFRYLMDDRLDWWFDHHVSAFQSDADRRHFEADRSGRKYFEPGAPSCAGFLARVLARDHGFDPTPFTELIHWAEIIDSASFTDPNMAVELREPALRLMTWIENSVDFGERTELIHRLIRDPLEEVARAPFVEAALEPVMDRHLELIEAMRKSHRLEDGIFFCDLTDRSVDAVNKFIPYYLHPRARYAVVVTRSRTRAKISVGYNPWAPADEREHDISKICQRHGGGGHAVVGAVSFNTDQAQKAVEVSRLIFAELRGA